MSAFELDTSGTVFGCGPDDRIRWPDQSPFFHGYFTAAARELYERLISEGWSADKAAEAVTFREWSPSAVAMILLDCAKYEDGARAVGLWSDAETLGAHFWNVRQTGAFPEFHKVSISLDDEGLVLLTEGK